MGNGRSQRGVVSVIAFPQAAPRRHGTQLFLALEMESARLIVNRIWYLGLGFGPDGSFLPSGV